MSIYTVSTAAFPLKVVLQVPVVPEVPATDLVPEVPATDLVPEVPETETFEKWIVYTYHKYQVVGRQVQDGVLQVPEKCRNPKMYLNPNRRCPLKVLSPEKCLASKSVRNGSGIFFYRSQKSELNGSSIFFYRSQKSELNGTRILPEK